MSSMEQVMKAHLNRGLFSNYYLDELLPKEEEFKIPSSKIEGVLDEVKKIWDKKHLSSLNEPQLRKHFLDKIFEILGWTIDVEPPTPSGEWSKHPDYALFHSIEDLKIAQKASQEDYFKKAFCIGEAKRWGRPLDRKLREEKDPFEVQNPSLQMSRYLWLTDVEWGILTDGKYWRLYERETSKRLDIFYEIDLESLVENGSLQSFKYFYLFFQKDAFPKFLKKVYKGSIDYAEAVGEELKENVYQALKFLAQGFLKTPGNNLQETHLKEIHDNSLILLYRLLFILYAEYRGLLPLGENPFYTKSYSLDNSKKEIAERLDRRESIPATTHGYWNKLKELFDIINRGNSELEVPPYNGGLFDPDKHEFLERYRVGDLDIVKAIDLLSRSSDRAYIDYGSLEIRHLGSIYEGLLEYKLKIADDDIVPIKAEGKNVFIPLEKAKKENKKVKEEEIVREGEVYLATDKGERKATGSYYTPDYIVKYIVSNTLGPSFEDKRKAISERAEFLKERIKHPVLGVAQKNAYKEELKAIESGTAYLEEILKTKILDPAMGSGHFLVEATDFLAMELLKVLSGEPIEGLLGEMIIKEPSALYVINKDEEEDIRWARREVVERCIFGVDLNPLAVELAKLSLWLNTVARNRPLSFLDHHLRCGNSLIGARLDDLEVLYKPKKSRLEIHPLTQEKQVPLFDESQFTKDISLLMGDYKTIEELPSDTVEQVKEKDRILRELVDTRRERYIKQADLWTSVFFGNEMDGKMYRDLIRHISGDGAQLTNEQAKPYLKKAEGLTKEKRFFHWELEFPEVFFDEIGRKRDNPGFDVVVGNPPYDVISEREQEREVEAEKGFFTTNPLYHPATGSKLNFYRLFTAKFLSLLCENGTHGFIVPMALLGDEQARPLREYILKENRLKLIEAFPQKDDPKNRVFEDAKLSTCLYVIKKSSPTSFILRVHPGKHILDTSPVIEIDNKQIEVFDPKNLSIPSYPEMTANDFKLALKLINVSKSAKFSDCAPSQQGEVNLTNQAQFLSDEPKGQIVLRGAHVGRYEFQEEPKQGSPIYLDVKRFLKSHGLNTKAHDYRYIRIGYQRGSAIDNWRRIIATIIEPGNFCSDTINYIVNPIEINLGSR